MEKLTREELNNRLGEIKKTATEDNYKHTNAMCYSMAMATKTAAFTFICDICKKEITVTESVYKEDTIHRYKKIEDIVNHIKELGYDANVKYICEDCNPTKDRFGRPSEKTVFEFRVNSEEEYNVCDDATLYQYRVVNDFLNGNMDYTNYQMDYTPTEINDIILKMLGIVSE